MAGVRDVAKLAGVSTATVVRVLSGRTPVSEELTERVLAAVEELDFVPSAAARSLTKGRTDRVGLLVTDIANPFSAQVARGLEDRVHPHGLQVLVGSSDFDDKREASLLTSFAARTVDAVALMSASASSPAIQRLAEMRMPVVFIDRRPEELSSAPLVQSDSPAGAREAIRHLTGLGHRDVGMISGPESLPSAVQRLTAFRSACREAGLEVSPDHVTQGHLGVVGGVAGMRELLALTPRPTAVLTFNNLTAIGALQASREAGVRIPDDISLITFDDMDLFPYVDPPITAIAQQSYDIGGEAGRLLLRMLAEPEAAPEDVLLPMTFHARGSCATPSGH